MKRYTVIVFNRDEEMYQTHYDKFEDAYREFKKAQADPKVDQATITDNRNHKVMCLFERNAL